MNSETRMPFLMAPVQIPVDFKWNNKLYHLTYPGFISRADLLATAARATSVQLIGMSYAHEDTTYTDEHGVWLLRGS